MPAGRSIGTIFVDFDVNFDPITRGQKKLLQESQTVGITLEENFRRLGIRTSAEFDLMRQKITNAYARITQDARATANDVLRAEQEKNRQLAALNEQQFGKQASLLDLLSGGWRSIIPGIAGVAAALTAMTAVVTRSISEFQRLAFEVRDLQFIAGGTVEQISGLIDVLDDFGVETSTVERAMVFLSHAIYEGSPALERLGIRFRDAGGHIKSGLALFYEVIDALHTVRSETERNALSQQIFSRGWTEMIAVIEQGAPRLREAAEASRNLITPEQIALARQWRGIWADVSDAVDRARRALAEYAERSAIWMAGRRPVRLEPRTIEDVRIAGLLERTRPIEPKTPAEKKAEEEAQKILLANLKEQQKETDRLRDAEYDFGNSAKYANDQFEERDRLWKEGIERAKEQQREIERLRENEFDFAGAAKSTNEDFDERERLWKEGIERAKEQQKQIERLREAEYDFAGAAQATLDAMQEAADRITAIRNEFQELFDSIGSGISTAIKGVILGTQTLERAFQNMAQNIVLSINDMIIKQGLNKLSNKLADIILELLGIGIGGATPSGIGSVGSSVGVGGFLGGAGKPFQHGGVVTRPTLALIGEAGPEAVVPLDKAGMGGITVVQNFTVYPGVPEAVRAELEKFRPRIKRDAVEAIIEARQQGGAVTRLLGQKGT